jgi:hypothetical protein
VLANKKLGVLLNDKLDVLANEKWIVLLNLKLDFEIGWLKFNFYFEVLIYLFICFLFLGCSLKIGCFCGVLPGFFVLGYKHKLPTTGQRVRHEMFDKVARSQSLPLRWLRTAIRRVWSPGLNFLDERNVELRDVSPAAVPTLHPNSVSHHCRWRLVIPALLTAWACSQTIICQVITPYIVKSLHTTSLNEVSSPNVQ